MLIAVESSNTKTETPGRPVLDRNVALALIGDVTEASVIAREISRWVIAGDESDDDKLAGALSDEDDDAYINALHRRWPEATDDDIIDAHDLAIAVAKACAL